MRVWGILIQIATASVGLLFPAYKSIEALESSGVLDDAQWLTYWLLYALLTVVERYSFGLLYYIPFFAELRLGTLVWLAVPPMSGAAILYKVARPHLLKVFVAVHSTVSGQPAPVDSLTDELAGTRARIADVKGRLADDLTTAYSAVATGKEKPSTLDTRLGEFEALLGPKASVGGLEDSAHGMEQ